MYYRYAVAIDGQPQEICKTKQAALDHAQSITINQHKSTSVYRQRRYPDTGEIDSILLVEYWWSGHLQFWQSDNF